MHVHCVSHGVKRPDIVKENGWSQVYTLDVTKLKFLNVDRLNGQVFYKNTFFLIYTNYSVFYLASRYNDLFSV